LSSTCSELALKYQIQKLHEIQEVATGLSIPAFALKVLQANANAGIESDH
jgi:hypothetical protein